MDVQKVSQQQRFFDLKPEEEENHRTTIVNPIAARGKRPAQVSSSTPNIHYPDTPLVKKKRIDSGVNETSFRPRISVQPKKQDQPILVSQEIDVNFQNSEGDTLLHSAAVKGDAAMVAMLISRGANYNLYNQKGQTPLFLAVKFGHEKVVDYLLRKELRCDINIREFEQGESALHMAALKGFERIAFLLLVKGIGANVNIRDLHNYSPLHHACIYGRPSIVRYLINCRADVNVRSTDGYTPLHSAAVIGNKEIVELLLDNKADINQTDSLGYTALAFAVREGREEIVQLMLQRGAIVNSKTNDGFSILHIACCRPSQRIIKMLVQRGAYFLGSPPVRTMQTKDPLQPIPVSLLNKSMVEMDQPFSNAPSAPGFTKWLFDLGVDLMRNKEGEEPIDYVELYGNTVAFINKMQANNSMI